MGAREYHPNPAEAAIASLTPMGRNSPTAPAASKVPTPTATGTSRTLSPAALISASMVPCLPMSMPTRNRSR